MHTLLNKLNQNSIDTARGRKKSLVFPFEKILDNYFDETGALCIVLLLGKNLIKFI